MRGEDEVGGEGTGRIFVVERRRNGAERRRFKFNNLTNRLQGPNGRFGESASHPKNGREEEDHTQGELGTQTLPNV